MRVRVCMRLCVGQMILNCGFTSPLLIAAVDWEKPVETFGTISLETVKFPDSQTF